MKYSEFEKEIKDMGFRLVKSISYIFVQNNKGDNMCNVDIEDEYSLDTTYPDFYRLDNTSRKKLLNICIELANTPVDARKDEKKYVVELPALNGGYTMSIYKGIGGLFYTTLMDRSREEVMFTEKEIKDIDERLWAFAKEVE